MGMKTIKKFMRLINILLPQANFAIHIQFLLIYTDRKNQSHKPN